MVSRTGSDLVDSCRRGLSYYENTYSVKWNALWE